MKLFISQPMSGLTNEDINNNREDAIKILSKYITNEEIEYDPASLYIEEDLEMEKSLIVDDPEISKNRINLFYFLRSIQHMVGKDAIVFLDGWTISRGCILEYFIAKAFKLKIIGEIVKDENGELIYKDNITTSTTSDALLNLFKYFLVIDFL